MPYLNIAAGEPWAETWGVMLFPEDEIKRRTYIARLWAGFYPTDEEAKFGEPIPRSVLLSIMKAAVAAPIDEAEIKARYYEGIVAGEQLKVLVAIAQSQPKRASVTLITSGMDERDERKRTSGDASKRFRRRRTHSIRSCNPAMLGRGALPAGGSHHNARSG